MTIYKPRPKRWPQFSLKGFFVLITVVGAGLGWVGVQLKWQRDRGAAIKAGVIVGFDSNTPAPWTLRPLGEKGIKMGFVTATGDSAFDGERLREMQSLFPEAELQLVELDTFRFTQVLPGPTSLDVTDCPLQDVIDYLKEYHSVEIQFDINGLNELSIIPRETTVSAIPAGGTALGTALDQILARVDKSLTFMVKDEVVLITSEEQKKVYDLRQKQRRAALRARPPQEQSVRLLNALMSPTSIDFVDIPLQEAIDYLQQHHQIEIEFDAVALAELGITAEATKVCIALKGTSLRSALNLLLARLDDSLTYMMRGDVLVITTRTIAGEQAADVAPSIR